MKFNSLLEEFKPLFYPNSVAVIGASNEFPKAGNLCMMSLVEGGFGGKINPVNPSQEQVLGLKSYPSVKAIPGKIDLAIVAVPNSLVPSLLQECGERGVRGAVIITSGFKELEDSSSSKLQEEITRIANRFQIKVIGPNTPGMVNTYANLNASFSPILSSLKRGKITLLSQSGGIFHLFSYLALNEGLGISKTIGLGNRANIEFANILEYLSDDPETDVIAMYLEGLDKPKQLIDIGKQVAKKKPVIVYKIGGSPTMNQASYSHTGSLSGKYELYETFWRQASIISVKDSLELFDVAKAFSICHPPSGDGVAIISPVAGPGIAAADACEKQGLSLPQYSAWTQQKLSELLAPLSVRINNPTDLGSLGSASLEKGERIVQLALEDENVDILLIIFIYQPMLGAIMENLLNLLPGHLQRYPKPIIACAIFPGELFAEPKTKLEMSGIPVYSSPERASKAISGLIRYYVYHEGV